MRLKLDDLQRVTKNVIVEQRNATLLSSELKRVFNVVADGDIRQVATITLKKLNESVRPVQNEFKLSVVVKLLESTDVRARTFASRIAPLKFLGKVAFDSNQHVRATVAKRLPSNAVSEMLKKFPNDELLQSIYTKKRLAEASKSEKDGDGFDMYGSAALGTAAKQHEGPELSELWYRNLAHSFMQDYGQNIEYAWEEIATRNFAAGVKATSGVEIDEAKLLKAIKTIIEEREDRALERVGIKEGAMTFGRSQVLTTYDESPDPVAELVEAKLSPQEYVDSVMKLFNVRASELPPGIRKHRLGENNAKSCMIPCIGYLPHKNGFRFIDEQALDKFCAHWNSRQAHTGEPLKIEWSCHPDSMNKIGFSVVLK